MKKNYLLPRVNLQNPFNLFKILILTFFKKQFSFVSHSVGAEQHIVIIRYVVLAITFVEFFVSLTFSIISCIDRGCCGCCGCDEGNTAQANGKGLIHIVCRCTFKVFCIVVRLSRFPRY